MITFDPNSLYALDELAEMLHGIVELPTLLTRLGLRERRIFRDALWGWEIIQAAQEAKAYSEKPIGNISCIVNHNKRENKIKNGPVRKLTARDLDN